MSLEGDQLEILLSVHSLSSGKKLIPYFYIAICTISVLSLVLV